MITPLRGAALISLLLLLGAAGCATTPDANVDWDSRIGTYTLEQAKAGMGEPDQTLRFGDGTTLAEWIESEPSNSRPAFAASPGVYGSRRNRMDRDAMESLARASNGSRYLHLTFSAEGRLLKWDRGIK